MKNKSPIETYLASLKFYTHCPKCSAEVAIVDFFGEVECPSCGAIFKPDLIVARKKKPSPSFRDFFLGEE
ncbi:MAG: hypothetical protein QXP56_04540 [Archaeoglobaceae archaeon]